jgi:hypothetical protein
MQLVYVNESNALTLTGGNAVAHCQLCSSRGAPWRRLHEDHSLRTGKATSGPDVAHRRNRAPPAGILSGPPSQLSSRLEHGTGDELRRWFGGFSRFLIQHHHANLDLPIRWR